MAAKKTFGWGVVTGIMLVFITVILYQSFCPTPVYTAKREIRLDNGSVITKGTKMTKVFCFPPFEWYEPLQFGVSVEKAEVNKYFKRNLDKRSNLKIFNN